MDVRLIEVFQKRRQFAERLLTEWNQHPHPFNWSTKSVAKVMAEVPAIAA
jgi:hypothetical protein